MATTDGEIDDLLKEFDVAPVTSSSSSSSTHPLSASPKPCGKLHAGETSVSFSTYGRSKGGGDNAADSFEYEQQHLGPAKRPLPKQLEPLRKKGLGTSPSPSPTPPSPKPTQLHDDKAHLDPWSCAKKDTLPCLKGGVATLLNSEHAASPAASPRKEVQEKPEYIRPRGESTIRCNVVKGGIVPMRRWGHGSCVAGNTLYCFGGMRSEGSGAEVASDMHEFNCETHTWEPAFAAKGEPPAPRHSLSMCVHHESIYIFGGVSATNTLFSDVHEYNIETQEWTHLAIDANSKFPERAETPAVFYGSKKLVIFGGRQYKENEKSDRKKICFGNDIWVFDVKAKKWRVHKTPKTIPIKKRASHAAAIAGHHLVIHGGCDTSDVLNDTWLFDMETHLWKEIKIDGPPRWGHTIHILGGFVYVFGGLQEDTKSSSSNKANNTLLQCAPLGEDVRRQVQQTESGEYSGPYLVWNNITTQSTAQFPVNSSLCSFGGAGVRHGILTVFGGKLGSTMSKEACNSVFSLLLTNDIVVETKSLHHAMAKILRRAQTRPKEWGADLALSVNGRVRYCHSAVLSARCPEFVEKMLKDTNTEEEYHKHLACGASKPLEIVFDANKRRMGLPIQNSDVLMNILHFYYTGRLLEYEELESLSEMSSELKLAGLADFLSLINPPALAGRRRDKHDTDTPLPLSQRVAKAEQASERRLVDSMIHLLHSGTGADMYIGADTEGAHFIGCLSTVLMANSSVIRKALQTKSEKGVHQYKVDTTKEGITRLVMFDLASRYEYLNVNISKK